MGAADYPDLLSLHCTGRAPLKPLLLKHLSFIHLSVYILFIRQYKPSA